MESLHLSLVSYLVDISILVDALNQPVSKCRSLGSIDDHLGDTGLLGRVTGRVSYKCHATIRLHQARVVWLRRIRVVRRADIDTSNGLHEC